MSNSQEQSLDENAVFLPVNEFSPEFLHCEKERQLMERLLDAGPEAFYGAVGAEHRGCFLSSEEVSQITCWAQDHRFNQPQVQSQENGEEGGSEMENVCSTYFPCRSDTPAPNLDLGWPEKGPSVQTGGVAVHTSPPAEGEPPVRQIVRQHLQKAGQVIAIVTDRLTDSAIIGDLHTAASRGVPVYVILNQRSIQENFTLNRLRHPNMRVRVLGGKTFGSRTGQTVVGEMKDNFLLVDLETVIHGSYSFTWTDAHLHRQLITVLSGPVVESFDREFRILFAASLAVPDPRRAAGAHVDVRHQLSDLSELEFKRRHHLEPENINPPSPPGDFLLDWEAMGVIQRNRSFPESQCFNRPEEITAVETSLRSTMQFMKNTDSSHNGNQFGGNKRPQENAAQGTKTLLDRSTFKDIHFQSNAQLWPRNATSQERMKRVEHTEDKGISRQLYTEKSSAFHNQKTTGRNDDKATEPTEDILPYFKRGEQSRAEGVLEEESTMKQMSSKEENTPSSRKPVILKLPQYESFSSLSDIMKKIPPRQSTPGRGSRAAASELSRSMLELSTHNQDRDDGRVPVPRFKASGFDPEYMTPALALMKKRNDELKPSLYRTPKNFLPKERPRSFSYGLWERKRVSLEETDGEQE
uniref:Family with sequence similarity 83 member E n=2 Tax=Gasterosteus aculeatus TaxID=69293 RepID=A0AAQ4RDZ3_GASAC|nr:protein FAM83A [Gasterosteus aculeatus aculeatus]XP_040059751.1 protein FAM83A [Gasterosteus aculeatus aculeatus]